MVSRPLPILLEDAWELRKPDHYYTLLLQYSQWDIVPQNKPQKQQKLIKNMHPPKKIMYTLTACLSCRPRLLALLAH